ncbi:MAG: histidine kinase [Actinomycetota bacterium]|nr:histidine kinase [Actinomycetota bacterium]
MTPRRTDLLVGLAGAVFGVGVGLMWNQNYAGLGLISALVLGAALGTSRQFPRMTWLVAAAALLLNPVMDSEMPRGDEFAGFLLMGAHGFSAGRWDPHWHGLGGLIALTGAGVASAALLGEPGVPSVLITGTMWGAGRALRERERVAAQLAERVRELEEEREAHAALSVRYERARIASELHDIVAHAISVMVVQASAGQRLAAQDPELAAGSFEAIADAARQAEQDMGRLVALLGDQGAIGPAPDLALVEELVARAAGSGLNVRLRLEGERAGLPAPVVQAAYRVVQEGLTNALRYASGAAVTVLVGGRQDALVVEVENARAARESSLEGTGTGNGLRGLRELVSGCGGKLEAGPTPSGGWRLSARLPRRVTAAAS